MAWSSPSSQTTGTLITAATWNQDVVDNPLLLKTPVTDGGALRRSTIATTTATSTYEHDIATDLIVVLAGDVTVALASATASSTGRELQIKNRGTGTVSYYSRVGDSSVSIDGTTSTTRTIPPNESRMLVRYRTTDWTIV